MQARMPQMLGREASPEIWTLSHFSERWALEPNVLGFGAIGMGMDEGQSAQVPLAGRDLLLEYARLTFEACDRAIAGLRDADLNRTGENVMYDRDDQVRLGATVLNHMSHITRHLGMIEALKGVIGQRGTVTI